MTDPDPDARGGAKPARPADPPPAGSEATVISSQVTVGRSLPGRSVGIPSGDGTAPVREVGRYQILEKLGEGAMAAVYKAYDPGIDRQLVIKFLHPELCRDSEYRMRFLREAKAAGMLSHPNIVTVFDVGEIENRPYIAMELLDGGTLNEMLTDGQGLALRAVLNIGIQIASALDYAHNKGIFHRDIKPSNMIRLAGSGTIKLADFGIAHVPSAGADRTQAGTVMGTPHYMSPEQALGEKIDARSDLWAVGVILYQLATGKRPFEADTIVTLLYRIANDSPKPVAELRKDIPPGLRRIIARCLNKQPDKRFQSGRELADALSKVLRETEIDTGREGKKRGIPLKVKLALGMATLVAVTMALTSAFVAHRQYQAMLSETVGHGSSLAKLMAVESAAPALSEDWVGIDVFVQEVARALELRGLSVVDRGGVVRVSTDVKSVGQPVQALQGDPIASRDAAVSVLRYPSDSGAAFAFETPIRFQDKQVGTIRLLMPEEPLAAVAAQSWRLMLLLLVITAATVTLATYLLVERYSRPLRLLRESMDEIGQGRFDFRIAEQRGDEFGELYRAFDSMAARLEEAAEGGKSGSPAAANGADATATSNKT